MSQQNTVRAIVAAGACLVLAGCMPKMTIEEMKAQMPKRPPELDRLNMMVGTWEYDGVAKFAMLDQPLKTGGRGETRWEGNGWYLVSRSEMTMEHFDNTQVCETYMYDMHDKKYRSTWVDSMGVMGTGESTYEERTKAWHWTSTSRTPWGRSRMKGQMRFLDDNTAEWSFTEYMGLTKTMEMSGTSKRVK